MLGIILLVFIGRYFYYLAEDYQKSKWLYVILGIVSFYAGYIIGALLLGLGYELYSGNSIETLENDFLLEMGALPFGLLSPWLLYTLLKKNWEQNHTSPDDLIDEFGRDV